MVFQPEVLDALRDVAASARNAAAQMKQQAAEAEALARTWEALLRYIIKGWSVHTVQFMDEKRDVFGRMRAEGHSAMSALEEVYRTAQDDAANVRRRFPGLLDDACREAGLAIDADSRHPRYYFYGKFFTLEVSEQTQQARLSDHEGRLAELPADVPAIVEAVVREHRRVFGRKLIGKVFLRKLRGHYLAVLRREGQGDGDTVPIRNITRRLGKNEKGFRTDEFLVDLSRLVEQGPLEIDGRRLDLQQTKDTSQGMLLHGAAGRGYVGFVVFRKVEQ